MLLRKVLIFNCDFDILGHVEGPLTLTNIVYYYLHFEDFRGLMGNKVLGTPTYENIP